MHLPEFDACLMHSALRASGIGRIKVQYACIGFVLFHLKKVNVHLLTSNYWTDSVWQSFISELAMNYKVFWFIYLTV